jgi:hypothetical protein
VSRRGIIRGLGLALLAGLTLPVLTTPARAAGFAPVPGAHSQVVGSGTSAVMDTTTATLGVVHIAQYLAATLVVPNDSNANVWILGPDQPGGTECRTRLFYCINPIVGAGHTVTLPGSSAACMQVQFFSGGIAPVNPQVPAASARTFGSQTLLQPGSLTPLYPGSLVITSSSFDDSTAGPVTINSSFSITDQSHYNSGVTEGGALAYLVQTTAAPVNPTWTMAGSTGDIVAAMLVFKPALPATTIVPWNVAYNGDIAFSNSNNAVLSAAMGPDLTYLSFGQVCASTAADSTHIVVASSETAAKIVGHPIQWKSGNICVALSQSGTTITVGALQGYGSANFGGTPQSGDAYTIFPTIAKFIPGPPAAGHTIWDLSQSTGGANVWAIAVTTITSPQNYVWIVDTTQRRVYGRDAAGTWVDGIGPICIKVNGDHLGAWQFNCDNVLHQNVDTWAAGGVGPPAGDGCFSIGAQASVSNVIVEYSVCVGSAYSYDVAHSALSSVPMKGMIFKVCALIGTSFYHNYFAEPGSAFSATQCTIVETQNVLATATATAAPGQAVITLDPTSIAGLSVGSSGNGNWAGHPSIPNNTDILSINAGANQVTLKANLTGSGIAIGDKVYFGAGALFALNGGGPSSTLTNCAVFGFSCASVNASGLTYTTCATDYAAGQSGFTAMPYASQFVAASGVVASGIDVTPKAGNGLGIGVGLTGNDLFGHPFTNSLGAIQFQAAATGGHGALTLRGVG